MKLSKDRLDVGLMTDDLDVIDFMANDVGLGDCVTTSVSSTITQHRFDVDGSIVKINTVPELDSQRRSGYRDIVIAEPGRTTSQTLAGPDGVSVELVPPGVHGVGQLGVRLDVPSLEIARRYFADVLGWQVDGSGANEVTARLGDTVVLLDEHADAPTRPAFPLRGWTYVTVHVFDCDLETAGVLDRGGVLSRPAVTVGDVVRYSMVADPFGNLVEIAQRAELAGPLPTVD